MKKFLGKRKEPPPTSTPDAGQALCSLTISEGDSLHDLPMFENDSSGFNDPNLNLNPTISDGMSSASTGLGKSLFSKYSSLTKQLSYMSNASRKKARDYGAPLQILEVPEDTRDVEGSASNVVAARLHQLWQDLASVLNQYANALLNLSTAVVSITDCLKSHVSFVSGLNGQWLFCSYDNDDVRRILRLYLHFYDNLLADDAYLRLRLLLCKVFNDFCASLKSHMPRSGDVLEKPANFAIGVNGELPRQEVFTRIIAKVAALPFGIKEQNGAFIAPIARGTAPDMNVLTIYFGYPTLNEHHTRVVSSIQELYDDVHVMLARNLIELAAGVTTGPMTPTHMNVSSEPSGSHPSGSRTGYTNTSGSHIGSTSTSGSAGGPISTSSGIGPGTDTILGVPFKLPFRTARDPMRPPMSLSLSVESSARVSGTLGGFIYPIIDTAQQPHLRAYAHSKFAISCGHVCLDRDDGAEYPYVSSPLSVLISLYKQALAAQHRKATTHPELQLQVAYGAALSQLDTLFPARKVKLYDSKTKTERIEERNFPPHRFGQIIWGERNLIASGSDKRLSDLAIIRVNKVLQCEQNFLGDDVAFNEYDPALIFDNLYVRRVIGMRRPNLDVSDVDSVVDGDCAGMPVFKYGSTTKFTRGAVNGIKLVYWMDGAIQSLEFVVNSQENTTAFAAGGDSGLWILTKLEDAPGSADKKGLGVVGMLHLYDGEYRQFGLFTPMTEILSRLEEVTKIRWGVVGASEKGADDNAGEESDTLATGGADSDSAYESLDEADID